MLDLNVAQMQNLKFGPYLAGLILKVLWTLFFIFAAFEIYLVI